MFRNMIRKNLASMPLGSRLASSSESTSTTTAAQLKQEILDQLKSERKIVTVKQEDPVRNSTGRTMRSNSNTVNLQASDINKHRIDLNKYYLRCLTSHSNTLITLTNHKHEPILWTSAGLCGFKKAARGGYEAGFRSTTMMLEKMRQKEEDDAAFELKSRTEPQRVQKTQLKKQKLPFRPAQIDLVIRDFGLGREAVMKALMGVEGDHYRNRITNIIDATPLKFGGVRARAVRRL